MQAQFIYLFIHSSDIKRTVSQARQQVSHRQQQHKLSSIQPGYICENKEINHRSFNQNMLSYKYMQYITVGPTLSSVQPPQIVFSSHDPASGQILHSLKLTHHQIESKKKIMIEMPLNFKAVKLMVSIIQWDSYFRYHLSTRRPFNMPSFHW